MSNLNPSMIGLDKGLNLQTAKIVAPQGSVLDTLNYEQVDFQGQKRIDGFTRYDGSLLSALDEYHIITVDDASAYTAGDLLASEDGLFGVAVSIDVNDIYVGLVNSLSVPAATESLFRIVDGANTNEVTVTAVTTGALSGVEPSEHYDSLIAFNQFLRDRVEDLPGHVAALHWFRDRLHAVASVTYISLDGTTPKIYPNDTISNGTDETLVLDAFDLGNTRAVFVSAMDPENWTTEGLELFRGVESLGLVANGYEELPVLWEIASFFEARTETQVLEEDGPSGPYDFGWKFIPLGWKVNFENGISLFGSLYSLNQNVEGIGTQGPTSVTGTNGRPLALAQKVAITNGQTQVNGWKSTESRTVYDLNEEDVSDIDDIFVYGDAYITWQAGSTPALPGYTSGPLTEYSPTNTIPVS